MVDYKLINHSVLIILNDLASIIISVGIMLILNGTFLHVSSGFIRFS